MNKIENSGNIDTACWHDGISFAPNDSVSMEKILKVMAAKKLDEKMQKDCDPKILTPNRDITVEVRAEWNNGKVLLAEETVIDSAATCVSYTNRAIVSSRGDENY